MQLRLQLTKDRFFSCDIERKLLRGEVNQHSVDENQIAQQDHEALINENALLTEDNENLRTTNGRMEEQIDELRDMIDGKDFISEEEFKQLQKSLVLDNNGSLASVLLDTTSLAGLTKKQVAAKLLAEVQRTRSAVHRCYGKAQAQGYMVSLHNGHEILHNLSSNSAPRNNGQLNLENFTNQAAPLLGENKSSLANFSIGLVGTNGTNSTIMPNITNAVLVQPNITIPIVHAEKQILINQTTNSRPRRRSQRSSGANNRTQIETGNATNTIDLLKGRRRRRANVTQTKP